MAGEGLSWNNRIIRLLELLVGTVETSVPTTPIFDKTRFSVTAGSSVSEHAINLGAADELWLVHRFHFVHLDGAATTYAMRFGEETGFTNNSIDQNFAFRSRLVTRATDAVFVRPLPVELDASGNLYFRPNYNGTGATNTAFVDVYAQKAKDPT